MTLGSTDCTIIDELTVLQLHKTLFRRQKCVISASMATTVGKSGR